MFNQIIGGYNTNNQETNNTIKPTPGTVFRNDISTNGDILNQSDTLAPDNATSGGVIMDTKIKNHIVVINSIDRNWYNYPNETPYNYLVKLGGSSRDKYSTVSQNYKNVVAFSIDKIILPNRPCISSYDSNIAPRLNDNPYLTIIAKGINFSSYGTNKTLNETIGIYTPLIPLPKTLSDISYLEFKNTSIQRKEYSPAPEGYISQLDLSINTPNGNLASNLNDVLNIYSIFLTTSNIVPLSITDTLVIQTSTYFNTNEFKLNDLIKIQGYEYHNMSYDESGIFNNWINSSNGHYIINTAKSNVATTMYNQIIIPIPASLSRTTGVINVEPWFNDFVIKSLSNVAIQDNGGKLINTNTQSHLVVNIKTLEKNDNIFFKDLK
jgi:hypothetical protein